MGRIICQVFSIAFALLLSYELAGQVPHFKIYGPYREYEGPYYIRVFIYYVQPSNNLWTKNVDLQARTAGILHNLNTAFNPYHIYFIGTEDFCTASYEVITASNYLPYQLRPDALNIFDRGDSGHLVGNSFFIPSGYCEISGKEGTLPGSHSTELIHTVGHCLGLANIFAGMGLGECLEKDGICPNGERDCHCCGDYVCDTPVAPLDITANSACTGSISPPNLPEVVFRNYMSATQPSTCRDRFTPGQAARMWAYLALAPTLQAIRLKETRYPASTPASVSGNIVITSGEWVVRSPLQMLPGATIWVEKGAKLVVASTITGACNKMWRGIIVKGSALDEQQRPLYQGQVEVTSGGVIEHAHCGIDVRDVNPLDGSSTGTGGGIVRLWMNAQIKDNIIGVRFGMYTMPNRSSFIGPVFSVTDEYRGGSLRPTLLELTVIVGLNIRMARFLDLRSECPPSGRAIGIDSRNAFFNISLSSRFEQLFRGITAYSITEFLSLNISGCHFVNCYKGIELNSVGNFVIRGNHFSINKPDVCSTIREVKGIEIRGNTPGFLLTRNHFSSNGPDSSGTVLIGTDCLNVGEGVGNVIFKNSYSNLTIGNRASGYNGYASDGLTYLCNTNKNNRGPNGGDFRVINGSIRKIQGEVVGGQVSGAAGNVFSGHPTAANWCTIVNNGLPIQYYFYDGDPVQDPGIPGDSSNRCPVVGFERKPIGEPNSRCADPEPCLPCPEPQLETWKLRFYQNHQTWLAKSMERSTLSDARQRAAAEEALALLRISMNQDLNRILTHYSLDATRVQTDSIVRWLALAQTYPTDLYLARHHFFSGAFEAFDALWNQLLLKYTLSESERGAWARLNGLYGALRPHLQQGGSWHALPVDLLNVLATYTHECDEAGFLAEAILRANGIALSPDCSSLTSLSPVENQPEEGGYASNSGLLRAYPNPTRDVLKVVYLGNCSGGVLRLYDLQGRLHREYALPIAGSQIEIPVGDLLNGLYLMQGLCDGEIAQTKIMILR
jgi:hypothetical protein